ncbi:hypothetical protein QYM36_020000 [Artemia franciscana]|uniref:Uncharacterized protein n=1 Tax=Artemia franciscana TaxID=6661 RepID=A0AA88H9L2_ARTSF|nr:hypothetical protein QYM36_020000 [Artemia franciscana]
MDSKSLLISCKFSHSVQTKKCFTEEYIIQIPEEDGNLSSGSNTQNKNGYRPSNNDQENLVPDGISSSEESTEESSEATAPSSQFGERPLPPPGQTDLDDVPLSQRTKRWNRKDVLNLKKLLQIETCLRFDDLSTCLARGMSLGPIF